MVDTGSIEDRHDGWSGVTKLQRSTSRILDAEVAGCGVTDLQGGWLFWVEVVAHIGCTGIQGFPHHLTGRATGGPIVAMTGVDPEACKSSDGIGARVTPIA